MVRLAFSLCLSEACGGHFLVFFHEGTKGMVRSMCHAKHLCPPVVPSCLGGKRGVDPNTYLAKATLRISLITVTLIWPGYCMSRSIF
jgi:hypothetical protein